MGVFAPLANRLGVWSIKADLEDLAFKVCQLLASLPCPFPPVYASGRLQIALLFTLLLQFFWQASRKKYSAGCTFFCNVALSDTCMFKIHDFSVLSPLKDTF
jgi:hypothetical protein